MERAYDIEDLKRLMERLRDPAHGLSLIHI